MYKNINFIWVNRGLKMSFKSKIILMSVLSIVTFTAQAQQAAIVQNDVSSQSYVGALENKVEELNNVIADLNSRLKTLGDRLSKAESVNAAINACAANDPPMVYAGSAVGCVEVKPAPCELCEPEAEEETAG